MIAERWQLYLLNLYFYPLMLLSAVIGIPLLTIGVACQRPFLSHRQTMKRFRRAMVCWGRIVMAIPFPFIKVRHEIVGESAGDGPYIFVCNHRSASDAFLMGVLPQEFVEIVNQWPFRIPVLGFFARLAGFLNIRTMPHEQFMQKSLQFLEEGVSIIFFPEGTRSATRKMGSFHGTAFRLALAAKVPIVPLCISGNEDKPPKGSPLLRPGTIRIRQLAPIASSEYEHLTPFAFKRKVWDLMDRELAMMESGL
jgi:1-acyl-sn-glycerol-3-phosphate acyltransferase